MSRIHQENGLSQLRFELSFIWGIYVRLSITILFNIILLYFENDDLARYQLEFDSLCSPLMAERYYSIAACLNPETGMDSRLAGETEWYCNNVIHFRNAFQSTWHSDDV